MLRAMPIDRSHDSLNAAERARLAKHAQRSEADLSRDLGGGWNVATALAHTAFWDRFAHERLRHWLSSGTSMPLTQPLVDALNDSLLPQWRALSPKAAAHEALAAAEAIDAEIRSLSDEAIEHYRGSLAPGQSPLFLDRTAHRQEHSDQIERALS
jgi:hypothetical protein